jgi:hypothetical protein
VVPDDSPPTKYDGKVTPNSEAPLSEWQQDSAYDTARECEAEKAQRLYSAGLATKRGEADATDFYVKGRCVPAEQVYLPKERGK